MHGLRGRLYSIHTSKIIPLMASQSLLLVLQALAHFGNDDFVDVITDVCVLIGVSNLLKALSLHT